MSNEKLKGKADKLKGDAKKRWGKLTKDEALEQEGKDDKLKGKVKIGVESIKETIKTIGKEIKDK